MVTVPRPRLPGAVIALGMTSLFTDMGTEMIFPLLPVFLVGIGAGTTLIGLIEGIADATASLLKLGSGYLADRLPRKKPLVLAGYGLASFARPLMALATAPWHALAVRITDRIGKGIRSAPRDAIIAASVTSRTSGRAFGFHRSMDHLGAVLGPLVATGLLAAGFSVREVFAFAIVPGLAAMTCVILLREPAPEPEPTSPPATTAPTTPTAGAGPVPHLSRPLAAYLGILALFSLGNSSDAFLLLRARDLGVPVAMLPILWSVSHVSKVVCTYAGGHLADRMSRPLLVVAGWGVYAATYLAFGLATEAWHAWALFVVYGLFHGLTEPTEKAMVRELAPAAARGRAYGYYNFILGVSAVPAGLLTGWLWQAYSPLVALATGAGLAALASVALVAWAAAMRSR